MMMLEYADQVLAMNSPEGVEPSSSISHNVNEVLVTITADAEQPEITPSAVHPGIAERCAPGDRN